MVNQPSMAGLRGLEGMGTPDEVAEPSEVGSRRGLRPSASKRDSELEARSCRRAANVDVPVRVGAEALLVAPPAISAVDGDVAHEVQLHADFRVVEGSPVSGEGPGVLGVD